MLIYVAIIPIVEELATVIVQALEVVKGKLILKIAEFQTKAEKLKEQKSSSTRAIGFSLPDSEEEYEEDYEEDD